MTPGPAPGPPRSQAASNPGGLFTPKINTSSKYLCPQQTAGGRQEPGSCAAPSLGTREGSPIVVGCHPRSGGVNGQRAGRPEHGRPLPPRPPHSPPPPPVSGQSSALGLPCLVGDDKSPSPGPTAFRVMDTPGWTGWVGRGQPSPWGEPDAPQCSGQRRPNRLEAGRGQQMSDAEGRLRPSWPRGGR